MDEATARAEVARRCAEGDGAALWAPRRLPGGSWQVVRLSARGAAAVRPTGAHVEQRARPEAPDDPRGSLIRAIPPYGPG